MTALKAPFPWFGGKSRVAHIVWPRLGDVHHYVDPFAGSLAVLLQRPAWHERAVETINDLDGHICNVWRSIHLQPDATAEWADWPVSEIDLHSRHAWLVERTPSLEADLRADPEYCDPKAAGWWMWGISCWIGSGWCSGGREHTRPDIACAGKGVHTAKTRSHLSNAGKGVHKSGKRPHLNAPMGVRKMQGDSLRSWFGALSERLRRVRVCNGDWSRVVTFAASLFERNASWPCGVLLDPPYDQEMRDRGCYAVDKPGLSADVREWCLANADNTRYRIALCGYEGEHDLPGWECVEWKASGGYGSQGDTRGRENAARERIWFSPHCLNPERQGMLFEEVTT